MDILTVCQLCVGKGNVDGYTDCMPFMRGEGDVDGYTDCIPVMCGERECRWIY